MAPHYKEGFLPVDHLLPVESPKPELAFSSSPLLVIEDDPILSKTFRRNLSNLFGGIEIINQGHLAVPAIHALPKRAIVLTDNDLTKAQSGETLTTGVEIATITKALRDEKEIICILMSGGLFDPKKYQAALQAQEKGILDAILEKPFYPQDLLKTVDEVWARRFSK